MSIEMYPSEIEARADSILDSQSLRVVGTLTDVESVLDMGETNLLVRGDVLGEVALICRGNVVVDGSILGGAGQTVTIEAGGDVVVKGEVCHVRIAAREIYIAGESTHCQLRAWRNIGIGAGLARAQVIVGDSTLIECELTRLDVDIANIRGEREKPRRQLVMREKALGRTCQSTRIGLGFDLNGIVKHQENEVQVCLEPFYRLVGDLDEEKIEAALEEFFRKGVMGFLLRVNREYIAGNTVREKIFIQLMRDLSALFFLQWKTDRQSRRIEACEQERTTLLEELEQGKNSIAIGGEVGPDVEFRFIISRVERISTEEYAIDQLEAIMRVVATGIGQYVITHEDSKGEQTNLHMNASDLRDVVLSVHEGQTSWRKNSH